LDEVKEKCCVVVSGGGHSIAVFYHDGEVHAVDNRCPHMGFPLSKGSVKDGILTCHWHHARFDLKSGGTFDPWADDVRSFPVEVKSGAVWVDVARYDDYVARQRTRLREGLEQNISLVMAKAAISLLDGDVDPAEPFKIGLEFGTRYRTGWGQGLTMHTCFMNIFPYLASDDRPLALYHGLSAVGNDTAGMQPNFIVRPLPGNHTDIPTLKRWFRRFVEVRDADGAERCIVSAVEAGATTAEMADVLFAAATDHRYIQVGHTLDFTNKALEALDHAGWAYAAPALASLAPNFAAASRAEESNQWRNPIDLVAILEGAFTKLPAALEAGQEKHGRWQGRDSITPILLGDDPGSIAEALLDALRDGATPEQLAARVAYAAALRIAQFHTSNEFGDWDTSLHTFTFSQAVHRGMKRAPSVELLRGVFDGAMSVYLDRFLNTPPARLPELSPDGRSDTAALLDEFIALLDRQQQVSEAAILVARYLGGGGDPNRLLATLGKSLLREDRNFHTIQMVEAAFRQYAALRGTPAGAHVLIAAARYLAAHSPTVRAQRQTYNIAWRLHRGERLYEGE
jgi:nitrite reductase/ring-hydroxylating ferredoxin subunit